MPKRKKAPTKQKQKQSQRQSVVVNIGTSKGKSKPRKSSGRGNLPPPSYAHNLAPTFITAPQVDYTPLLASIIHSSAKIQETPRIEQRQTPLTSAVQASQTEAQTIDRVQGTPQEMARTAALRRAGRTADNFQTPPSQVRSTEEVVRPPDSIITEVLRPQKGQGEGGGGGRVVNAEARVKRGPRFQGDIQTATPEFEQRTSSQPSEFTQRVDALATPETPTLSPLGSTTASKSKGKKKKAEEEGEKKQSDMNRFVTPKKKK